MNYTDLVPLTYSTNGLTNAATSGTGAVTGVVGNIYDDNTGTYYEYKISHGGDGTASGSTTFESTWTTPAHVYSTYLYATNGTYGGNYKESTRTFTTYLKIGGSWTQIDTRSTTDSAGSNVLYTETYEKTVSTGWDDVTGIKVYLYGRAYSYEGDRQQYCTLRFCEVGCNREKYEDGLQIYDGSQVVKLGTFENSTSHPLKIYDGTNIRSIPILDPSYDEVSPVRIYNGSAVKCLPLAD